jgi:hypothetical protein
MAAVSIKLLAWPMSMSLPVLDGIRMITVHVGGVRRVGLDAQAHSLLVQQLKAGNSTHAMLVLRSLCNIIAKRLVDSSDESFRTFLLQIIAELDQRKLASTPAHSALAALSHK